MSQNRHITNCKFLPFILGSLLITSGCAALTTTSSQNTKTPRAHITHAQSNAKPVRPTKTSSIKPVAHLTFQTVTASLDDLINLAAQNNPQLAIARAQAEAARGKLIQAGLYPNPIFSPEIDNVNGRGNSFGEPGLNIQQEFVRGNKLGLAQAAAAHGVSAAQWRATTQWFTVVGNVQSAYYDVLAAQRETTTTKKLVTIAETGWRAARKLVDKGAGNFPDVVRAEVLLEQTRMNLAVAQQRVFAARKLLAVAVGVSELPYTEFAGDFPTTPTLQWEAVRAHVLAHSSEVREAEAKVMQADGLLCRAKAEPVPNVRLHVRPSYFLPDDRALLFVRAGVAAPLFNRNQGNIRSARASVAQAHAELDQVKLQLTQRLTLAYQNYRIARQQTDDYKHRILKKAQQSRDLVELGYQKRDPKYDYTAFLQAQQTLSEAELAYARAQGTLWRAIAELSALMQQPAGGSVQPRQLPLLDEQPR